MKGRKAERSRGRKFKRTEVQADERTKVQADERTKVQADERTKVQADERFSFCHCVKNTAGQLGLCSSSQNVLILHEDIKLP